MALKLKEALKKEIIGSYAEVIDSKNKSNIGIKGKIIDETKNTIKIDNKMLFKNNIRLKIKFNNEEITINGNDLAGKPKERIKK